MPLVCLGLSHQTTPVDVRERHSFPATPHGRGADRAQDYEAVHEAAMLSTCGRIEIYAEIEDYEAGVEQLRAFLRNFRHADVDVDMSSYLYTLLGEEAIEHFFRVSTGLDSMLIGEAEILAQVKDAYVQAQRAGSLGRTLHALFREALSAGKAARSQTRIGSRSTSVATAAIDLIKRRAGSLEDKTVVVVGAGKMGSLAAKRLRQEGCRVLIANRSQARARVLAAQLQNGEAVEFQELAQALERADVVVTSTGASHFILRTDNVAAAMRARPERPLFVVDIAVPRDAEPEIGEIPNVTLADIDAIKGVVETTLEQRRTEIPLVEEIIAEHVQSYGHWYQSRVATPVVASLVEKAEAIRQAEIERLFGRCPDLSEREKMLITGASLTIVSKMLHGVVTKLAAARARRPRRSACACETPRRSLRPARSRPRRMNASARGSVALVGAGPGDPGLLTLKAAHAIAHCDVLVYDYLAAAPIVALAPPDCEKIYVGKKAGAHTRSQDEINALLVRLAREGRRVVRLKGGDAFVFGRGAEEAEVLVEAGVAFEVVPGISSALAAPAYAGIPLTHRGHNTAFTVATGHEDPQKASQRSISRSSRTPRRRSSS